MRDALILDVDKVSKSFGTGNARVDAVKSVTLKVARGKVDLIMGPSGSGKTTLLSMLGGLLKPSAGNITIDGVDITRARAGELAAIRACKIGFIFQAFNLLDALTVRDNILFPAPLVSQHHKQAQQRADQLIERLGLSARRKALPATLSGGEKQRVAIARALINQPPLILADEPTGNLDSQSGQEVMMVLQDIAREEGRSVIIVSHDSRIEAIADQVLWLEDGILRDRLHGDTILNNCPVCQMPVDELHAKYKLQYEQTNYIFCSKRCYDKFNQDMTAYL